MRNLQLEVRKLLAAAAALPSVDYLYSDTRLENILDEDADIWFWRQIESQFNFLVSKTQKEKLATVEDVIFVLQFGLKLRSA